MVNSFYLGINILIYQYYYILINTLSFFIGTTLGLYITLSKYPAYISCLKHLASHNVDQISRGIVLSTIYIRAFGICRQKVILKSGFWMVRDFWSAVMKEWCNWGMRVSTKGVGIILLWSMHNYSTVVNIYQGERLVFPDSPSLEISQLSQVCNFGRIVMKGA